MKSPCIVAFGGSIDFVSDVKVVIENNVLPMPSVMNAMEYCVASYYVFNMAYPLEIHPLLIFFEKYIFDLKPSHKLPLSAAVLYDNLQKVLDE